MGLPAFIAAPLAAAEDLRVAAAADLAPAQSALAAQFQKSTGLRVQFVTGSSGILARQVENGAPYDLFLAANESFVRDLAAKDKVVADSVKTYATGRLAWFGARSIASLNDLPNAKFIAIANPAHAPYGVAAKQALTALGLWEKVSARIVMAENARQAFAYAESRNADVAITAWSIVKPVGGTLIDAKLHAPIRQTGGIVRSSQRQEAARKFLDFLLGARGQEILREAGFDKP